MTQRELFQKSISEHITNSDHIRQRAINIAIGRKRGIKLKKKVFGLAAVAMCICLIGVTVYAAAKFLTPKEIAQQIENPAMISAFEKPGATLINETQTDGGYSVTVLGIAFGKDLENKYSADKLEVDKTYVAIAISKTDGSKMSLDEQIVASPLFKGLNPVHFNIFTFGGGFSGTKIEGDGILYRIFECENAEIFADRQAYLAVYSGMVPNSDVYHYDEATGIITTNPDYAGLNLLFDLPLDKSKADSKKADAKIAELTPTETSEQTSQTNQDEEFFKQVEEVRKTDPKRADMMVFIHELTVDKVLKDGVVMPERSEKIKIDDNGYGNYNYGNFFLGGKSRSALAENIPMKSDRWLGSIGSDSEFHYVDIFSWVSDTELELTVYKMKTD